MRQKAVALILYALAAPAHAWVVQPGPLFDRCSVGPPVVKIWPKGAYEEAPAPTCVKVPGWNSYHFVGGRMVGSQQIVAPGTPCGQRMTVEGITYGLVTRELWAVCKKETP